MEDKFERERQALIEQYARIRKTVEETERERYEFEIEKFKKEQGKSLEGHKTDIERLKTEKRKIQGEYNQQIEGMKRDMERRLEKERKELQEQMRNEVEEVEREE